MPEPLVALSEDVWGDIDALCRDLSDAEWDRPTDCPGWTVKDHVAHMIGTENMLLGVQAPAVEVAEQPHIRNDIGRFNEQWVVHYHERSGTEALADFRAVTKQRLDVLRTLPAEKWDEEGFTPEGRGPYRQFMAIRVFDCWYHDQDIREAVGRAGYLDGPVADLSLQRVIDRGLPYIVGKKAAAPQHARVRIDVQGATPLVADVVVDGRAAVVPVDPGQTPATTIELDRRTFSRLAGGRWSGERARADGHVQISGDAELGGRVVDNMGFTI
jgi:uncharacterized protein (TIGR03083 family)